MGAGPLHNQTSGAPTLLFSSSRFHASLRMWMVVETGWLSLLSASPGVFKRRLNSVPCGTCLHLWDLLHSPVVRRGRCYSGISFGLVERKRTTTNWKEEDRGLHGETQQWRTSITWIRHGIKSTKQQWNNRSEEDEPPNVLVIGRTKAKANKAIRGVLVSVSELSTWFVNYWFDPWCLYLF